jgi:hypothetical protein
MRKRTFIRTVMTGLMLAAALSVACGDDPAGVPGIQPEIVNNVDNFQFQVTAVNNYTGSLDYTWSNTGVSANVDQSCSVSGGTVMLALIDDAGQTVYTKNLSEGGSFASSTGTTGTWRIHVTMMQASGNLNFRVDKRTP